jgi:hypothetical protein
MRRGRAGACRQAARLSRQVALLAFGRGGDGVARLSDGWSQPEDGFCWSLGTRSTLRMPFPAGDGEAFVELSVNPFRAPGGPPRRLRLSADGICIGEDVLHGEGIVAYRLPAALRPGGDLKLALETDPAPSLAELGLGGDARKLGFMLKTVSVVRVAQRPRADATALPPIPLPQQDDARVGALRTLTGLSPRDLLLCFESLGHNCEFGMLQRHVGAEPMGLLRFAGVTMNALVSGLQRGFEGVGDEVVVRTHAMETGGEEYIVYDDRYGIGLHSFETTATATADQVRIDHEKKLTFAAGRFKKVLKDGTKCFVFQRTGQITRSQALVVANLLQGFGPNALLYVDTEPGLPSGAVEQVGYGLFHGRLDRMAPAGNIGNLDILGWLSICANAWRLWQKMQTAPAMP